MTQKKNFTILPYAINQLNETIVCKLVAKSNHLRKKNYKIDDSDQIIEISINEPLNVATIKDFTFMYKISRCGSTLLSNMLELDTTWKIIEEPLIFAVILNETNIDKVKYMKKAVEILTIKENSLQTHVFFNLFSQALFHRSLIEKTFPEAFFFYLYRQPAEVAESLFRKTPGWMKQYKDIKNYLLKSIKYATGLEVYYYRNILSMNLIDQLYKKLNLKLTDAKYKDMRSCISYYSKNTKVIYDTKNVFNYGNASKHLKEYFYDDNFTNFFLSNPPYRYLNEGSNLEKLSWKTHKENILKKIESNDKPFIISDIDVNFSFGELTKNAITKNLKWGGLWAEFENYYIWHDSNYVHQEDSDYDEMKIFSSWKSCSFVDWKKNKNVYLMANVTLNETTHPLFDYFNSKNNENSVAKKRALRLSHNGAITCEHFDGGDTLLYVGGGKKRMYLIDPSELQNIGVYPKDHPLFRRIISNIVYHDTFNREINKNNVFYGDINAGEAVFFPSQWTHLTITEEEETWSMNFRKDNFDRSDNFSSKDEVILLESSIHPLLKKGKNK